MALRILKEGRWGVEPHGLAVHERSRELCGVVHLQPRARVNEQREARCMAFGEAIFGEAVDLLIEALAELLGDAARTKAFEQALTMTLERSCPSPRGHVATQAIRLSAGVTCTYDGDLHDLLLEERYAERTIEDGREERVRRIGLFLLGPPPQVRVHHVALDRAGPNDRDFYDEVVEALGP